MYRNRLVAGIEIEKKLQFCSDNWRHLSKLHRQQVGECVASEVQCRLERRWFSQFISQLESKIPMQQDVVNLFESSWSKEWNKRLDMTRDRFGRVCEQVIEIVKEILAVLPVSHEEDGDLHDFFVLPQHRELATPSLDLTAVASRLIPKANVKVRPSSSMSIAATREAIRRPKETMSRILNDPRPPSILTIVDISCESPDRHHFAPTKAPPRLKKLPAPNGHIPRLNVPEITSHQLHSKFLVDT
jgi:hypothetical protein